MPLLPDYAQFNGRHWETGTIHNYYAYRGVKAPHTGEPYSEALLMGVSGGIVFGYFNFLYEGHDPQCNILTRNTFDPWDTMLSRLGVVQHVEQTQKITIAEKKLLNVLEEGVPAMVWADMWSLPYTGLVGQEMWGSFPILVYGLADGVAHIADRAQVALTLPAEQLAKARGRIKKDRFRLVTLEAPDEAKLKTAVHRSLCQTVQLMTEKPPKGSANNFGLKAFQFWVKMLTKPKQRKSWAKQFPVGAPLYAGLKTAYEFACLFGKDEAQDAERTLFAEFVTEAALILQNPALHEVAERYRESAQRWQALPQTLLPEHIAPFQQTRALMAKKHHLFLTQGEQSLAERDEINGRLHHIRQQMETDFPLTQAEAESHLHAIAAQVQAIYEAEERAIEALSHALA